MKIKYLNEGYFKNPKQIKKELENKKSVSVAEKVSSTARSILLKKFQEDNNIKIEDIEKYIKTAITISDNDTGSGYSGYYSKINKRIKFEILGTDVNSECFRMRLSNRDNLVSLNNDGTINVKFLYFGTCTVSQQEYDYSNKLSVDYYGNPQRIVPYTQEKYLNDDVYYLKNDLQYLLNILEEDWPGVMFDISASLELDNPSLPSWVIETYYPLLNPLVRVKSDIDKVIEIIKQRQKESEQPEKVDEGYFTTPDKAIANANRKSVPEKIAKAALEVKIKDIDKLALLRLLYREIDYSGYYRVNWADKEVRGSAQIKRAFRYNIINRLGGGFDGLKTSNSLKLRDGTVAYSTITYPYPVYLQLAWISVEKTPKCVNVDVTFNSGMCQNLAIYANRQLTGNWLKSQTDLVFQHAYDKANISDGTNLSQDAYIYRDCIEAGTTASEACDLSTEGAIARFSMYMNYIPEKTNKSVKELLKNDADILQAYLQRHYKVPFNVKVTGNINLNIQNEKDSTPEDKIDLLTI